MRIIFYPGFDLDKFTEFNSHLRPIGLGRNFVDVVEVGSTAEVEAAGEEVSIEQRLAKLEKDFYSHSHMNNDGDNPCAGDIIFKIPEGTFGSCYDKPAERKEQAQLERGL